MLEVVVTSKLDDSDAQTVAKAASCLNDSGILESDQRNEVTNILNGLQRASESITMWSPFDSTTANGLSALCSLSNKPKLSASVMNAVSSTLEQASEAETPSEPQSMIQPLLALMQRVTSLGHDSAFPQSITLPLTADEWPAACNYLADADPDGTYWKYLRPKAEFSEIAGLIGPTVSNGQFGEPQITVMRVTSFSPIKSPWTEVVNLIRKRLDAGANVPPKESYRLYRGLCALRRLESADATTRLKDLADKGHTLHHFHRAYAESHDECKALCLFAYLRERPGAKKPASAGNSDAGHENLISTLASADAELAKRFMALLREFGEIGLLRDVVTARGEYDPFICLGLRDVAKSSDAEEVFTPSVILESWEPLRSALNDSSDEGRFTTLVGRLVHSTTLCRSIQDAEKGFSTNDAELYLDIFEAAKEDVSEFAEWCKSGVEHLSKEQWTADFKSGCVCCRLALDLANQGHAPELKTGFADALAAHAQSVTAGKQLPPENIRPEWRTLLDLLDKEAIRKELRTRLIDVMASEDGKLDPCFFELYGAEIDDVSSLVANDRIVSHLFSPIVRQRNVAGLTWLDALLASHTDLLQQVSDKTAVEAFEDRLRDYVTEALDDDAQPLIEQIAKKLGIEAAEVESEASNDSDVANELDHKVEEEQ